MSEEQSEKNVRRVRRNQRKEKLEMKGPLFPVEEEAKPQTPAPPPNLPELPPLDLDALPDPDSEALALLASLSPEEVRPLKITPEEERFPAVPSAPVIADPPAEHSTQPMPRPALAPPRDPRARHYNRLTLFMLILTMVTCGLIATIWRDPFTILNPFPPEIVYIQITATFPPPGFLPRNTPAPIQISEPGIQPLRYTANTNERGCAWASIGGSVRSTTGSGLTGYRVVLRIPDAGQETVFSGSAAIFGAGGYEHKLADEPIAATYEVQLYDLRGEALSEAVTVQTRATCEENVVTLDFILSP